MSTGCLGETNQTTLEPLQKDASGHWIIPSESRDKANPFTETDASKTIGQKLYASNCIVCHGEEGKGDGPQAMMLEPKPADLHDPRVQENTDGTLFHIITAGAKDAAMPPFTGLSEEDRWHLVNYVRTFKT